MAPSPINPTAAIIESDTVKLAEGEAAVLFKETGFHVYFHPDNSEDASTAKQMAAAVGMAMTSERCLRAISQNFHKQNDRSQRAKNLTAKIIRMAKNENPSQEIKT